MKKKLKVGVIGLGHQALEDHIPAILLSPDVKLQAVAEADADKLASFLPAHKNVNGYTDFNELFKKETLDFVVICAPHYLHYEITKKAINCGVHVLKEKPFATSLSQGRSIKELADKNNIIVSTTLQRRFNPIYLSVFQLLDKIGKPFFIDAKYTFFTDTPHEGWRGRNDLAGGGCLIDMGYHIVDLLMWYFGLPDCVFTQISCDAKEDCVYDAEDTAQVMFKYTEKHLSGSLLVSRVMPPKQEVLNIYGTRGSIHLERGKIERYSPDGELQESLSRQNHWPAAAQDQLDYFVKIIVNQKQNIASPESHFNHLAFIEAAYKSKDIHSSVNPYSLI
jgi:predicted dehydrogenase